MLNPQQFGRSVAVIDNLVDNGVNNENWMIHAGTPVIDTSGITFSESGQSARLPLSDILLESDMIIWMLLRVSNSNFTGDRKSVV